jgi:ankyrin repeat protein
MNPTSARAVSRLVSVELTYFLKNEIFDKFQSSGSHNLSNPTSLDTQFSPRNMSACQAASQQQLLNPVFAQPHFQPDADTEYACSAHTKCRGWTYLHALVMGGAERLQELESFVASTPKVELEQQARQPNSKGWTALMLAARNSRTDSSERTVELLLPHSDAKQQTKGGLTALMLAVEHSGIDSTERTVELLLPYSDAKQQDNDGWTALMLAASNSRTDSTERTVELLLPHSDAKQQTVDGWTALMFAAHKSGTDSTEHTVELLLPHSDVKQRDHNGQTALTHAAHNSQTTSTKRTVELLLRYATCAEEIEDAMSNKPEHLSAICFGLFQSVAERATLSEALKSGIPLPGATVLTYL